jgi:hypothetical protein
MLRNALRTETETVSTESSASRKSSLILSSSVHSTFSDLSCVSECGGKAAPVDIWHPDFWAVVDDAIEGKSAGSLVLGDEWGALDLEDGSESEVLSLPTCLKQMDDLSNGLSAASLEDDDETVLSDISDPDDVKRALYLQAMQLQPSSTAHSERSPSLIGSIVGNPVSSRSSCMSKSSKKSKRSKSRHVSFSNVHIRQYERILNDNPACRFGVSIGIGWNHNEEAISAVDEWEEARRGRRLRTKFQLIISRNKREALVRKLGYADSEIAAAMREINRIKCQRRQTVNNLNLQHIEETVESTKNRLKLALRSKRRHA